MRQHFEGEHNDKIHFLFSLLKYYLFLFPLRVYKSIPARTVVAVWQVEHPVMLSEAEAS